MITTIDKLLEIAGYLDLAKITENLRCIQQRLSQSDANIILPLVGEFSSGKTTLINALTDSKKLETATKPTTATIYEVHFSSDACKAVVLNENGEFVDVDDISELKNEILADAKVVTVFDTSKRISSSTIIVDTPGLSSPDPKHKQTLVEFLPKADGILLVIDVNQQITRSLTDFVDTMKLSKRPIFLVLTKCDTKSLQDVEAAKKYIYDNCKIPIENMVSVSASTNNLDEFYSLLDSVQKTKKEIIKQVDGLKVKNIITALSDYIEDLMKASSSDKDFDESIRQSQYELDKLNRNIEDFVLSMADDIEEQERVVQRRFEDTIFAKLNDLVVGSSNNFDGEAVFLVNSTASLLVNEYKGNLRNIIREKSQNQRGADSEIYKNFISDIDLSSIQMSEFSYNLDLNNMGHEYDGMIKTGLIAATFIGGAAVMSKMAAAKAASTAAGAGATEAAGAGATEAVTTATSSASSFFKIDELSDITGTLALVAKRGQNNLSPNKGIIDSMIGFATDKLLSKPQRVRAIRNYIDTCLMPEFKIKLNAIDQQLVSDIRYKVQEEAASLIEQKAERLNQLKIEYRDKKDLFNKRMEQLRDYKTILLTL